jgi:hypothetical protein
MPSDKEYIVLYRTLIEKKFLLGIDGKLKQRELEYLGNLINEKSHVRLSISTLKRLWRDDIIQLPHPSTLDALVSLLDLRDWQEFKKLNADKFDNKSIDDKEELPGKKQRVIRLPLIIALGLVALTAGFFIIQGFIQKDKSGVWISKNVLFTADKTVTSGVPNTVMFHYDLSGVQADSFFIQQSWNPRDKVPIDPKKNYYSTIYYTPGFHWARIMANDSILKFVKVHIKSDGWLPLVKYDRRDKKSMYLDATSIKANGVMRATDETLHKANVDITKDFYLRYYNIRDFDGIESGNFDLETKFKCDKLTADGRSGTVACPSMEIMVITEENVFFIPLTTKGCVSELELLIGEVFQGGKDNDLSALGTNVYEWQVFQIKNQNKKTTLLLNGVAVHELTYKKDFGKIKGIIYTFTGRGSVDFIRLKNLQGATVYEDDFQ